MARVFVSVLGTRPYIECIYKLETRGDVLQSPACRFVQEAIVSLKCLDWNEEDRILILTTKDAEKKNWLDGISVDPCTKEKKFCEGLKTRLHALGSNAWIDNKPIPDGRTDLEIQEIFATLYKSLQKNDTVIFDITHSFRSIPMLVLVALNYAKVLNSVNLEGIYYGAFDVLGNIDAVCQMPVAQRIAPIFDLSVFDSLLDWSTAVDRFIESGDASLVSKLTSDTARSIKKRKMMPDEGADALTNFSGAVGNLSKSMATCRAESIATDVTSVTDAISRCRIANVHPAALIPLLDHLGESLNDFSGDQIAHGIMAAKWCKNHNLVQQGYTILREMLISHMCHIWKIDSVDSKCRLRIERAMGEETNYWRNSKTKKDNDISTDELDNKLILFRGKQELLSLYSNLINLRNDINHAGFTGDGPTLSKTLISELKNLIQEAEKIILKTP
jgi:CRISPR-associated Csx2 family protein